MNDTTNGSTNDPAAGSGPVRVVLVGLGGHGRTIQDAVARADSLQVVGVYDLHEAEARAAVERFGCEAAPSFDVVLRTGAPEAVILATPNSLHRAQAEAAFREGCHVFVEKPIANTVADAQALLEAADRAGRRVMVGHNMRRGRAARHAARLIEAGRLGTLVSFEIHYSADNTQSIKPDAWRLRPDQCPLLPVMQLGIHAVDLVHYLIGPVVAVAGTGRSVTTPPSVVDSVAAVLQTEDGVTGTMISNYCTQVAFELRIAGTEGSLCITPHDLWFRSRTDNDRTGRGPAETMDYAAYGFESYTLQMQEFGDRLRSGAPFETDGPGGLRALAVVEALDRARHSLAWEAVPGTNARSPIATD